MDDRPTDKGGLGEASFLVEAFRRGWEVCKPFHHCQPYDFLMRRSPKAPWETVQVKTAYPSMVGLTVRLTKRRAGKLSKYLKGDFDYLFVVGGDETWLIPWAFVSHVNYNIIVSSGKYLRWQLF